MGKGSRKDSCRDGQWVGRHIFVPYNGKIADITEADTATHYLTLANSAGTGAIAGETRKIIAILSRPIRVSGTGYIVFYPNEGATESRWGDAIYAVWCIIKDGTQRLQYNESVANDDWDVYCFGYVVEA